MAKVGRIDELLKFTLTFTISFLTYPKVTIMSVANTYQLKILKLSCYSQEEADGDEIFLKYNQSKIWPTDSKYVKVKEGDKEVGHVIERLSKDTSVTIELWDWDLLSPNDKLGEFTLLLNERGGPFTTDLKASKGEDAKYSLEWEVN